MIQVHCRTNLDLRGEQWPDSLPAVPAIGDHIQSRTVHTGESGKGVFQLELAVCRVTWRYRNPRWSGEQGCWIPEIEMHMTSFHKGLPASEQSKAERGSIVAFYEWYAPLVGTYASAFI